MSVTSDRHLLDADPKPAAVGVTAPSNAPGLAAEHRDAILERETATPPPPAETPFRRFLSDFLESRVATAAVVALAAIILLAVLAPFIVPQNPYDLAQVDMLDNKLPPGSAGSAGYTYWLGTDGAGRDLLSAILYGLRISLSVGVLSGFAALTIGVAVGLLAAYAGGRVETMIMRIVDLQLSFPAVLVALMLVAVLGRGVDKIIIALILVQWAYYARTVRGNALVERRKDYVEAARCLGLSRNRIVFRHILPNCLAPLIVVATVQTAHAIALEATLSFLGVGLPQTEPSLGALIANGFAYMTSGLYWISIFPGIALLITIVTINLVGDQLRDVLNPRLSR
ncbi:MAG: ABC transporter permease [Pseudomonadota bacterium]|nr:ABC transporter permease [Pseudomonadota bacterium]